MIACIYQNNFTCMDEVELKLFRNYLFLFHFLAMPNGM